MTPKEKAINLVDKFLTASFGTMEEFIPVPKEFAKQCALICVDELELHGFNPQFPYNYLTEVKEEIKKL
jgi:hypothetical protein